MGCKLKLPMLSNNFTLTYLIFQTGRLRGLLKGDSMNTYSLFAAPLTYNQLNLIFLAVGLVFVVFAMFWGLVRGFKKTAFRTVWLIVTALALFFLTPVITRLIINFDVSKIYSFEIDGQVFTTLQAYVESMTTGAGYANILQENPVLLEVTLKLLELILNSFIFVLLFWLAKIILWPIWAIISAVLFKKRDSNGEKIKKHRLLGMLTGAVLGLFIGALTLMPILSTINLATSIERQTEDITVEEGGVVTSLLGADIVALLNGLPSTYMGQAYKYSGLSAVNNAMFNKLTTGTVNGQTISLQKDIKNAIVAYSLIEGLTEIDTENLTQAKITSLLNTADQLVDLVFNVGVFTAIGTDFWPYMLDGLTSGETFFLELPSTDDAKIDAAIIDGLTTLKTVEFTALKTDLKSLIAAVRALNASNIILQVQTILSSGDEFGLETAQEIAELFDNDLVASVVNNLYSSQVIAKLTPIALNVAIDMALEMLDESTLAGISLSPATAAQLKSAFTTILTSSLAILNSLDLTSEFYATSASFVSVGKLLDAFKSFPGLSQEDYQLLINFAADKAVDLLHEQIEDIDELPAAIITNLENVINNLKVMASFEADLTKLGLIFNDALSVYNAIENSQAINYATIGKILNNFKSTTLIGGELTSIIKNSIDYAFDLVDLSSFGDLSEIITGVKANVNNSINWETEFTILEQLISFAQTNLTDPDFMDDLLSPTALELVGETLNSVKQSALLGNQLNSLIATLLATQAESFTTAFVGAEDLIDDIVENIQSAPQNINWEVELGKIANFITAFSDIMDDPDIQFSLLGANLDNLNDSAFITRETVNSLVKFFIDEYLGTTLNSDMLATVKNNVTNIVSFAQEFASLDAFLEDFNDTISPLIADPEDINLDEISLKNVGAMLNKYSTHAMFADNVGQKPSVLVNAISPEIYLTIIGGIADAADSEIFDSIKQDAEAEIANLFDYETEFDYLQKLADYDTLSDQALGLLLDDVAANTVTLKNAGNYLIEEMFDTLLGDNAGEVRIEAFLAQVKTNTLTALESTLTFAGLFGTADTAGVFETLENNLNDLKAIDVTATNPAEELANALTEISQSEIVGDETGKHLAHYVLDKMVAHYNSVIADEGSTQIEKDAAEQLLNRTIAQQTLLSASVGAVDYGEMFDTIYEI